MASAVESSPFAPKSLTETYSSSLSPRVLCCEVVTGGAADMKGNICAFIEALGSFLKTEKLNYRIAILLTSNEEGTPEDGFIDELLEELKSRGETIDYCLVGEPSSSLKLADTIRIGRRGSLSGNLKIIG